MGISHLSTICQKPLRFWTAPILLNRDAPHSSLTRKICSPCAGSLQWTARVSPVPSFLGRTLRLSRGLSTHDNSQVPFFLESRHLIADIPETFVLVTGLVRLLLSLVVGRAVDPWESWTIIEEPPVILSGILTCNTVSHSNIHPSPRPLPVGEGMFGLRLLLVWMRNGITSTRNPFNRTGILLTVAETEV